MTAMMANPKKRPYQPALGGGMSIQEYNTRKKYADMGFSERMTDFFYGAEKAKQQEELQERMKKPTPGAPSPAPSPSAPISSLSLTPQKSSAPIRRDASGWPVNPNRVTSLRPGAGINPGQSTYGFSSMQPSNRAGEVYTIDQWGNKRYL
jgi:hypothetical protein